MIASLQSILKDILKYAVEPLLDEELEAHLGYPKSDASCSKNNDHNNYYYYP